MKELSEGKEIQKAYLQIDLHYLQIEIARKKFDDKFKNMSELDLQISNETRAMEIEGGEFIQLWIDNLNKIVELKKVISADFGSDLKVLEGLYKITPPVN